MERLTEKHIVNNIDCGYKIKKDTCEDGIIQGWNKIDAINKLGQLEDIEEELGIDLITLFKARKGICYKNGLGTIYSINPLEPYNFDIDLFNECIYVEYYNKPYRNLSLAFSEYGKTWALTKEELEGK